MSILQIEHRVRDFDRWKSTFDSDPLGREENGVRRYRVLRPPDDPNYVVVHLEFDSGSDAEAFRAKVEALWGRAGADLGLENPESRIVDVVDAHEY